MNPEDILAKLEGQKAESGDIIKRAESILNKLTNIDPDVEQSGVPDFKFRADFSRMDTDEERMDFLDQKLGRGNWKLDKYGYYTIMPEGQKKLGLKQTFDQPLVLDEPGLPTLYDLADLAGDAPSIAGGVIGGMATGGAGWLAGLAGAAGGTAIGKGLSEIVDQILGENKQAAGEVATDVATEAGLAAAGEGIFRGALRPLGRKIMAPEASRMTPEARKMVEEATAIGARPAAAQVTKAPILGRTQAMFDLIFGDTRVKRNAAALNREIESIQKTVGIPEGDYDVGMAVKESIRNARGRLADWSRSVTSQIDKATGGKAVVPTATLKDAARKLVEDLPVGKDGKPVFVPDDLLKQVGAITDNLPDFVTTRQMQRITTRLWDAVDDNTLVPGLSSHDAKTLWKAAVDSYGQVEDEGSRAAIKAFRRKYAEEISKFDQAIIQRLTRDSKYAGSIEPEQVVSLIVRRGNVGPIRRVMSVIPEETRGKVRSLAMRDILETTAERSDDPLVEVFTGKRFLDTLDKYGKDGLNAIFGKEMVDRLYRLGRVMQLVTMRQKMSGGIVAANLALHPIQNFPRLIKLNIMSRFMSSPTGLKYFTEGLTAPKTRTGAAALSRAAAQIQLLADEEMRASDDRSE